MSAALEREFERVGSPEPFQGPGNAEMSVEDDVPLPPVPLETASSLRKVGCAALACDATGAMQPKESVPCCKMVLILLHKR